jgi:hypothetical protein
MVNLPGNGVVVLVLEADPVCMRDQTFFLINLVCALRACLFFPTIAQAWAFLQVACLL